MYVVMQWPRFYCNTQSHPFCSNVSLDMTSQIIMVFDSKSSIIQFQSIGNPIRSIVANRYYCVNDNYVYLCELHRFMIKLLSKQSVSDCVNALQVYLEIIKLLQKT